MFINGEAEDTGKTNTNFYIKKLCFNSLSEFSIVTRQSDKPEFGRMTLDFQKLLTFKVTLIRHWKIKLFYELLELKYIAFSLISNSIAGNKGKEWGNLVKKKKKKVLAVICTENCPVHHTFKIR